MQSGAPGGWLAQDLGGHSGGGSALKVQLQSIFPMQDIKRFRNSGLRIFEDFAM